MLLSCVMYLISKNQQQDGFPLQVGGQWKHVMGVDARKLIIYFDVDMYIYHIICWLYQAKIMTLSVFYKKKDLYNNIYFYFVRF